MQPRALSRKGSGKGTRREFKGKERRRVEKSAKEFAFLGWDLGLDCYWMVVDPGFRTPRVVTRLIFEISRASLEVSSRERAD